MRDRIASAMSSLLRCCDPSIPDVSQEPDSRLCELCQQLDLESLAQNELPRSHPITYILGTLAELTSRAGHCQFCHLVVSAFAASWKQQPLPTSIDGVPVSCKLRNRAVCVVAPKDGDTIAYSENFAANEYEYSNCRITVASNRAPPGCLTEVEVQAIDDDLDMVGLFGNEKLLSRRPRDKLARIDWDLAKAWLLFCAGSHGEQCRQDAVPKEASDGYVPFFRLIDVQRGCVVDAQADWNYVALSYVWGQSPMLKLLLSNKDSLYKDNALLSDEFTIAQTIKDAIEVTQRLEEKYLWVDSLCIMQDDYAEKEKVIGEMDLIYNRAGITIVAAAGSNAGAGLSGLRTGTREIDGFEKQMCISKNKRLVIARSRPTTVVNNSIWNHRGWTYQERFFSHRMLIFTSQQLLYWCRKSSWCEDTVLETDNERVFYDEMPLYRFGVRNKPTGPFMKHVEELPSISMLEEYAQSVAEYSRRQFSFQGDVLDAFKGLEHSMRASHKLDTLSLEFYSGLPSAWFDMALCWTPVLTSKVHRRHAKHRHQSGIEIPFPSWSWTGWIGEVEYAYIQNIETRTRPEVKFYMTDHEGFPIPLRTDLVTPQPLPPYFQSSNAARTLRSKWKPDSAPVDISRSDVQVQESNHQPGPHLVFYSCCAFLPVVERHDGLTVDGNESNPTRQYFIVGESKGWISIDAEWMANNPASTHEFVVISRSMENDWADPGMCDMLHVMLIERCDGMAYRVGIGSVSEAVWADAESEWKIVHLG